jgi:hypothetical protein
MIGKKARRGAAAVVIGVALFATLGEASKESGSGTASNPAPNAQPSTSEASAASGEPEPAAPASSADAPIPLGTPTEVAAGWEMTVNSANLNADAVITAENQFATPEAGTHFVLVNVTLANKSDKPSASAFDVKIAMLPPSGVAVDSSISCSVYAGESLDRMAQMQPGSVQTGNLCFEVKAEEIATSLLLGEPQFTMDEIEDQRFFAIQ